MKRKEWKTDREVVGDSIMGAAWAEILAGF